MEPSLVRACQCPTCQRATDHPDKERHRQMNLFVSLLDERQRRWYAALESTRIGHGGDRLVALITGLDEKTIRRGRAELALGLAPPPDTPLRRPGGGRPATQKKSQRS